MSLRLVGNKPSVLGVLDLQGGVHEHVEHLESLDIAYRKVKHPHDFDGLAGLIIPGGESTCISRLLNIFEIKDVLLKAHKNGMKIWGTCAGAILVAREVTDKTRSLDLIDIVVERNGFGSQLDSFVSEAMITAVSNKPVPLTFIRAPKIVSAGKEIHVLLKIDDYIAAAESENILVTVFHPELTGSLAFHRYFALKCGMNPAVDSDDDIDPEWNIVSWTKQTALVEK